MAFGFAQTWRIPKTDIESNGKNDTVRFLGYHVDDIPIQQVEFRHLWWSLNTTGSLSHFPVQSSTTLSLPKKIVHCSGNRHSIVLLGCFPLVPLEDGFRCEKFYVTFWHFNSCWDLHFFIAQNSMGFLMVAFADSKQKTPIFVAVPIMSNLKNTRWCPPPQL